MSVQTWTVDYDNLLTNIPEIDQEGNITGYTCDYQYYHKHWICWSCQHKIDEAYLTVEHGKDFILQKSRPKMESD